MPSKLLVEFGPWDPQTSGRRGLTPPPKLSSVLHVHTGAAHIEFEVIINTLKDKADLPLPDLFLLALPPARGRQALRDVEDMRHKPVTPTHQHLPLPTQSPSLSWIAPCHPSLP